MYLHIRKTNYMRAKVKYATIARGLDTFDERDIVFNIDFKANARALKPINFYIFIYD